MISKKIRTNLKISIQMTNNLMVILQIKIHYQKMVLKNKMRYIFYI